MTLQGLDFLYSKIGVSPFSVAYMQLSAIGGSNDVRRKNVSYEVTTGESLESGGYFVAYNYVVRNVISVLI